jgi:hypothetical protein
MGAEGLEPSRPYSQQILSLLRLPFRHAPVKFRHPGPVTNLTNPVLQVLCYSHSFFIT